MRFLIGGGDVLYNLFGVVDFEAHRGSGIVVVVGGAAAPHQFDFLAVDYWAEGCCGDDGIGKTGGGVKVPTNSSRPDFFVEGDYVRYTSIGSWSGWLGKITYDTVNTVKWKVVWIRWQHGDKWTDDKFDGVTTFFDDSIHMLILCDEWGRPLEDVSRAEVKQCGG